MNADQTPKQDYNSELIKREKIEGTPFTIIEDTEKGWYVVMGNYIITKPSDTKELAMRILEIERWNIILTMIIIVINKQLGNE